MHLRPSRILAVVIVVLAGALQGCLLSEKVIRDKYVTVPGVKNGFFKTEITIRFPRQYCIPPGSLEFRGKIDQGDPLPDFLFLSFLHWDPTGSSLKSSFSPAPLSVMANGTIPTQSRTYPGDCFDEDDQLEVRSMPSGGDVQEGAQVEFELGYPSLPISQSEERILIVEVKAAQGATGKVRVIPRDKEGRNECALPGPDPKKPNERACEFLYDVPDGGRQIKVVAEPGASSAFNSWGGECKKPGPAGEFPFIGVGPDGPECRFLLIGNFDEVSAKFKLVE